MTASSDNSVLVNDGTSSKLLARQAANLKASDNAALAPLYNTVSGDVSSGNFLNAFQTAESYNPMLMTSNQGQGSNSKLFKGATPTITTQESAVSPITQMLESGSGLSQLDPSKTWSSSDYDSYYKALTDPSVYNSKLGANTQGGIWGNAAAASSDASKNYALTPGAAPNVGQFAGARPAQGFDEKYLPGILKGIIAAGATAGIASGVGAAVGGGLLGGAAGGAAGGVGGSLISSGLQGGPVTLGGLGKAAALGGIGGGVASFASPATGALTSAGLPAPLAAGLIKGAVGAGVGAIGAGVTGGNVGGAALGGGVGGFLSGAIGNSTGSALLGKAASSLGGAAVSSLTSNSTGQKSMAGSGSINPGQGAVQQPVGGATVAPLGQAFGTQFSPGAYTQSVQPGAVQAPASTDTSLAQTIGGALPGLLTGAAGVYGAQNAAEAQQNADNSAINTQQSTMGNINNIWSTQQNLGQGAQTALGTALGTNGQPMDPSTFYNQPGYQFAVQQGTQAIQRQAASMGNAYTPNTAEAVGQYVTGTASQNYNTYIQQLMGAAGLGSTANQGLQTGQQTTGSNISQLQQNIGQAQASGVSGAANAVGGLFGVNGAGTSLIGAAGKALAGGSMGGGGSAGGVGNGGIGGTGFNASGNPVSQPIMNYGGQNPNGTVGNGTASDPYGANTAQYNANNPYTYDSGSMGFDPSSIGNTAGSFDPSQYSDFNFSGDSTFDPSNTSFSTGDMGYDETDFLGDF